MILFLDIDGVLHEFSRARGPLVLLPHFERVMREFLHVQIVISSAWRQDYSLAILRTFFSPDISERIIGCTPILGDPIEYHYSRHAEIQAWLREEGREYEPWVALDDNPSFFPRHSRNLVVVDPDRGFSPETEAELRRRFS